MNKLTTILLLCATLVFGFGCGDDDDDGPAGPTPLTRMEVRTDLSAPPMTSVDDAVWDSVTPTPLDLSNSYTPPIKTAAKPLLLSDSVYVQAIKADGKLFLRLEWDDSDFSIKRDQWYLMNASSFSFNHYAAVYEEDQVFIMFEMANGGWDTWNWRALTTGQSKAAEGWTYADSALTVDADNGVYTMAWENYDGVDNSRPIWVHKDKYDFVGDVMFIDDTLNVNAAVGDPNWYEGMTVPGWIIIDTVLPSAMTSQSRWDIAALYDYNESTGHYKLVMSRSLTSGTDDLDMSSLTEMKVRIGVLDDMPISSQGSSNIFTDDFMMDF